ncbi:MAG: hypothetical protein PXX83_08115 [Candidatus Nitrosotalea sp.]|nr:hypothetical protein [Candidatus Nitrosotalea sp.]
MEKDAVQYSLYYIASGADLFPHVKSSSMEFIVIPRGVVSPTNVTSFIPLHLEIFRGTTVVWINEDSVGHVIQSTDDMGKPIPPITSDVLRTNEEFSYTFENPGIYHYYDPLDSWRMGTITVW